MNWVDSIFPDYGHFKQIKDADWQMLYEKYHTESYDVNEVKRMYDDVKQSLEKAHAEDASIKVNYMGIFEFVLSKGENISCLNARMFTDDASKQARYDELEDGEDGKKKCPRCGKSFTIDEMEQDHIIPYSKGGQTKYVNLQLLCKSCNCSKNNK